MEDSKSKHGILQKVGSLKPPVLLFYALTLKAFLGLFFIYSGKIDSQKYLRPHRTLISGKIIDEYPKNLAAIRKVNWWEHILLAGDSLAVTLLARIAKAFQE